MRSGEESKPSPPAAGAVPVANMTPAAAAESTKRTGDEAELVDGIDGDDSARKPPAKKDRTSAGSAAASSMTLPQNLHSLAPVAAAAVHVSDSFHTNFTVDASVRQALQVLLGNCAQRHPMATKLESLMEFPRTVKGTFELDNRLTLQLKALRSSECQDVPVENLED